MTVEVDTADETPAGGQVGGPVEWFDALAHTVTVDGDWPRCAECGEYGSHEDCQPEALTEQAEQPDVDAAVSSKDEPPRGPGVSAPMVAALENAWSAIRARHPEVPPVVIVLGAGSGNRNGDLKLGHFAALRWTTARTDTETTEDPGGERAVPLAEVFVGGEGLARGPVEVLGTLVHEATHALADVRGVKDTSRQGRWHNARFKALAEELGIEVTKDPRIGWSPTTVAQATREHYASVIVELGAALRLARTVEMSGPGKPKKPSPPPCVCGCGRRLRVAPSVLELGPIVCGLCDRPFAPETDESGGNGGDYENPYDEPAVDERPGGEQPHDEQPDDDRDAGEEFAVGLGVAS